MKKEYLIIISILLVTIIGVFIYIKLNDNLKHTKSCEISKIKYLQFGYSTGTVMNASVSYYLYIKDNKYYIDIKPNNVAEADKITKEVTEDNIKRIQETIKNNEICRWNGFDKNDPNVLDGNSFSLSIGYVNGNRISASGYEVYPDNYREVKDDLENIFSEIKGEKK